MVQGYQNNQMINEMNDEHETGSWFRTMENTNTQGYRREIHIQKFTNIYTLHKTLVHSSVLQQ